MSESHPKIEIFAPFGVAFEVMKKVLFQPFDLKKWCVIGFAAFISGAWGSGFGFNPFRRNYHPRAFGFYHGRETLGQNLPSWFWPAMVVLIALALVIIFVLIWIVSRGRFIFTDCLVRNRGAIVAPWCEFRREGNSYFRFNLVATLVAGVVFGGAAVAIFLPLGVFHARHHHVSQDIGATTVFLVVAAGLIWMALAAYLTLVLHFMVPVMYRRRCGAMTAFTDVARLIWHRPAPFLLLGLFGLVLLVAFTIIGTIVACATCCIGALPYVSTVLLLPAHVWLRAFLLCFLRQFGPEYDVWAEIAPTEPPPLAPPPSASQDPPPLPA